jgi:type I restriction enzyme S subunit
VRLWGEGAYERESIDGGETRYAQLFRAEAGDVIVNKIWARNGSVAVVGETLAGSFGSGEFPMFRPRHDRVDVRWLHWLTKTPAFWEQCDQKSRGTSGQNRIRPERFLEIEIPLPPLDVQRRSIARIEELAAQIDEARSLRRAADGEREAIWPSILQATLLGSGRPPIANGRGDTAADLLATATKRNAAFQPSNNNNAHPQRPALIQKGPADLPDGWAWTTLGSVLSHLVDCVNDTPDFAEANTGLLGLKSTNIRPYKLDLGQRWYVSAEDFARWNRREAPKQGDIVLTREAPMGNACMLPSGPNVCLTQRLMLLRVDDQTIEPDLLLHFLNSPIFQDQVKAHCRGLTTPHVRVQDAPNFVLPLPPRDQQQHMVGALAELRAEVDALNRLQNEIAAELDAMLPSILDRAFRGEL